MTGRARGWPGCGAGARHPPAPVSGVTGAGFGFVPAGHARPAKFLLALNRLPKPPLPPPGGREMLVEPSRSWPRRGTGAAFGSVFVRRGGDGDTRSPPQRAALRGRKGKSWEFHLSSTPSLSKNQGKICFYGAKILLGKLLRDLLIFNFILFFFSWIGRETLLGHKGFSPIHGVSLRMLAGLNTAPGALPGPLRRPAGLHGRALFSP